MIETIIEGIVYLFVEVFFQGVILGVIKVVKWIGLMLLKIITLDRSSIEVMTQKNKGSAIPYILGFGLVGGVVYLILMLVA